MKDDGGSAFPQGAYADNNRRGMTLRDYFASKAMQGILAMGPDGVDCKGLQHHQYPKIIASIAYVIADAMIAERNKEPK